MASTLFPVMVVHDINSSNKILLAFVRYDNNYSFNNVEEPIDQCGELEIPKLVGVYEQNLTKLHLEHSWK